MVCDGKISRLWRLNMTIKTLCEVCGKTVRYTDPEEQVAQTIYDPYQFCRGHIAEPTWGALRTIMKILGTTGKNPNNRFFISKETGSYLGSAYLNPNDGSYFPSIPRGAYEIGAGKKNARSYSELKKCLHEQWIELTREEISY